MKYKKRIVKGYDKFNSMTINSVPCSSDEFNSLKDGKNMTLSKAVADEMLAMGIIVKIKENKNGN